MSCPAAAVTPLPEAASASSTPATSSAVAGRRQRAAGSLPSGNSHTRMAVSSRNTGQAAATTTASQPSGSVP